MDTLRGRILQALTTLATGLPGVAPTSVTRERTTAVEEGECPAIDLSPDRESKAALGEGVDRNELTAEFKIYTAGAGASSLADPMETSLHTAIFADPTLGGIAGAVIPQPAEFDRAGGEKTIARTTVRYRIIYTSRRNDPTRSA